MSNYWNNALMLPAPQLRETMTGDPDPVEIGTLLYKPLKLIFNSLSDVEVTIYISTNGGGSMVEWMTFDARQGLVLDDDLYTFPLGTIFYGDGASGDFSISYTYAPE